MTNLETIRLINIIMGITCFASHFTYQFIARIRPKIRSIKLKLLIEIVYTIMVWIFIAGVTLGSLIIAVKVLMDDQDAWGETFGKGYVILPALVTAYMFYSIRNGLPFVYGFIEVTVGIAAILLSSANIPESQLLPRILALSAEYIMVRGFENISKQPPLWAQRMWWILKP